MMYVQGDLGLLFFWKILVWVMCVYGEKLPSMFPGALIYARRKKICPPHPLSHRKTLYMGHNDPTLQHLLFHN